MGGGRTPRDIPWVCKKMEKRHFTVDDVVQQLNVTPRTLHYYEEVGLIEPVARTVGGHRLYDENVVERLRHILRLKEYLGYSLNEIREVLGAEAMLDQLRVTYHSDLTEEERTQVLNEYLELLQSLVHQIDGKLEKLTEIRESFVQRLERTQTLLQQRAQGGQNAEGETQHAEAQHVQTQGVQNSGPASK